MRTVTRTTARVLAPAALLALSLTACGGNGGASGSSSATPTTSASPSAASTTEASASASSAAPSASSSPTESATSSSSPEAASSSASGSAEAGAWDPRATEAAIRGVLGPETTIETMTAQEAVASMDQNPDVDALGQKDPQASPACVSARATYSSRVKETVRGAVTGYVGGDDLGSSDHSIAVIRMDQTPELEREHQDTLRTCGMAATPSPAEEAARPSGQAGTGSRRIAVDGAEGTAVEMVTQRFEDQARPTGTPDSLDALRILVLTDDSVVLTSSTKETTATEPAPLDAYVDEQTPGLRKVLAAARG